MGVLNRYRIRFVVRKQTYEEELSLDFYNYSLELAEDAVSGYCDNHDWELVKIVRVFIFRGAR